MNNPEDPKMSILTKCQRWFTENPDEWKGGALFTWKSIVFPTLVYLLTLRFYGEGWAPFLLAVIALAFIQKDMVKVEIEQIIEARAAFPRRERSTLEKWKDATYGVIGVLLSRLFMYTVGLMFIIPFLVPITCNTLELVGIEIISEKSCKNATDGLMQFFGENSGGERFNGSHYNE